MSGLQYEVGDVVCLLRSVSVVPGSAIVIGPGDEGVVTQVGDHFLALHVNGVRTIAAKGDVARLIRADRPVGD